MRNGSSYDALDDAAQHERVFPGRPDSRSDSDSPGERASAPRMLRTASFRPQTPSARVTTPGTTPDTTPGAASRQYADSASAQPRTSIYDKRHGVPSSELPRTGRAGRVGQASTPYAGGSRHHGQPTSSFDRSEQTEPYLRGARRTGRPASATLSPRRRNVAAYPKRRSFAAAIAMVVVIVSVACGLWWWHPWSPSNETAPAGSEAGQTGDTALNPDASATDHPNGEIEEGDITIPFDPASFPVSTPRERWRQGTMPYLYQKDVAWRDKPYAGGTVGTNACGPTCMDMVYIYLTGDASYTPADFATQADAYNFAPTGATEWRYMTEGAALLGITGTAINPYYSEVVPALEAGMPVVASLVPGDFTTVGHYIVLTSIDEHGMVSIHDPNSVLNSMRKWGLAQILRQANMCWAFSA